MPVKGISYCRKSITVKEAHLNQSVSYQQSTIEEYAKRNKIEIVKSYNDIGYSGKTSDRPDLQEMLMDLKTRKIDVLLLYSIDRLGRDLVVNIEIMLEILSHVKSVVSISEGLSSDSENFKLIFLMFTGMAQTNRENLLNRLNDGRKSKVLERKSYDGIYPLGYVLGPDERIVPATFKNTNDIQKQNELFVLQFIYYSYLFGDSLRGIAKKLNEKFGFTRKDKKWDYKSVKYILENRIYSGVLCGTLGKIEHYYINDANIEPIIDPLLHELILKKLSLETSGRKNKTQTKFPFYIVCDQCVQNLKQNKEHFYCQFCNKKIEYSTLHDVVQNELKNIIGPNYENKDVYEQLCFRLKLKEKKLEEMISVLSLRKEKIIRNETDYNKTVKDELIECNTKKTIEYQKEKYVVSNIFNYVNSLNNRVKKNVTEITKLMNLPYLIICNFEKEVINVLFHSALFLKGTGDRL